MADLEKMRKTAAQAVESMAGELTALSERILHNPEVSLEEHNAVEWLTGFLESRGFGVEKGVGGMPTAFKATYGRGSPAVAVLCEYDALPGVGHGCGHNLIAAMGVGAGVAVKAALESHPGTIVVMGTPGEESAGGKITMLENGQFKGIDAAMMVHPSSRTMVFRPSLAAVSLYVTFKGRAAHAAGAPHEGINALEAMILTFTGINSLRQHLREDVRIHGIITKGGSAPNVVPDYTEAEILVRAKNRAGLDEVVEKVRRCVQGAGMMTGAKPAVELGLVYAERKDNPTMSGRFGKYITELGMKPDDGLALKGGLGSSDIGNVSQELPAIHPYVAITSGDIPGHTEEFARAAGTERAHLAMLAAAKAMAMTCLDLIADSSFMERVKRDFRS
ncbi:MAG: M20 family metallopeptidase [Ignavibacteriales bacterium]